jgi:hypothetical protein
LDESGLSPFGRTYWQPEIADTSEGYRNALLRERLLEHMRLMTAPHRTSRSRVLFAAQTVEDALRHAQRRLPPLPRGVPIVEITSSAYFLADVNWLDFVPSERTPGYFQRYWIGERTNHQPLSGARREPLMEALVDYPVVVGQIVAQYA